MAFDTSPLAPRQNQRELPVIPIAIEGRPPDTTLHLKIDGFFLHQLVSEGTMLIFKGAQQAHKISPLRIGELESPGLPSNQTLVISSAWVPGKTPSRTLLLDHPGSKSG